MGALGPGPPSEGDAPWLYRETVMIKVVVATVEGQKLDTQLWAGAGESGPEVKSGMLPVTVRWHLSQIRAGAPRAGLAGRRLGRKGGWDTVFLASGHPTSRSRPWPQQGGRPPPSAPRPCFPVPTTPLAGPGPQGNAFQQLPSWAPRRGGQEGGPPGTGFSLLCFVQCQFRATLSSKA